MAELDKAKPGSLQVDPKTGRPAGRMYVDTPAFDIFANTKYFNPLHLLEVYNGAEPLTYRVFFQRPCLYLEKASPNFEKIKKLADFKVLAENVKYAALIKSLTRDSDTKWLPYLSNRCRSAPINTYEISSSEKGGTYHGHSVHYAEPSTAYKKGGTLSFTFANDYDMTALMSSHIWTKYINYVSKSQILAVNRSHIENSILDYAAAIYVIVTRKNGKDIVFWQRYMGTFPKESPFNVFEFSAGTTHNIIEEITLQFEYSIASEPYDIRVLTDFNQVSGATQRDFGFINTVDEVLDHAAVKRPVIIAKRYSSNNLPIPGEYELGWQEF